MTKQSEFYHTFKRLRPSDGTAWDTEKERVLEQAWWEAMVRADEMLEVAEFESLVAAKLADIYSEVESEICHVCPAWRPCFGEQDCRATILKYARLQVEGEMGNEP